MKRLLLVCMLFSSMSVHAQIITTVAGNGIRGYCCDWGLADSAELHNPRGIAIDSSGNVYIADVDNNRVRKVSPSGAITTIAGNGTMGDTGDGGPADSAELHSPSAVALDGSGNLYIVDAGNACIRKVDSTGIITTIAGSGTGGYSGDGGPATSAKLYEPSGIAIDGNGNIYIADYGNRRIRKINPSGIISTIAGNGNAGYSGDGGPATLAELYYPWGVAVDGVGNIFIADGLNNRIRKVDASGVISTYAGNGYKAGTTSGGYSGDGGPATSAELYLPCSVAISSVSGNLYIADNGNNRIRRVSTKQTGVNELSATQTIKVYPNPSTGSFTINILTSGEKSTITLYDLHGVVVETKEIDENTDRVLLELNNISRGTYLLKVQNSNTCQVQKIILE